MGVAESIDVENVYISRSKKEILEELSGIVSVRRSQGKTRGQKDLPR